MKKNTVAKRNMKRTLNENFRYEESPDIEDCGDALSELIGNDAGSSYRQNAERFSLNRFS